MHSRRQKEQDAEEESNVDGDGQDGRKTEDRCLTFIPAKKLRALNETPKVTAALMLGGSCIHKTNVGG